jgi:hypothetical protein
MMGDRGTLPPLDKTLLVRQFRPTTLTGHGPLLSASFCFEAGHRAGQSRSMGGLKESNGGDIATALAHAGLAGFERALAPARQPDLVPGETVGPAA